MSARRRGSRDKLDVFDSSGTLSLEETDASIFGGIAEVDAGRQVAKPVSIFDIYPDPAQPRRAMPSPVRGIWNGNPDTMGDVFGQWYNLAIAERGGEFEIEPYLLAREEVDRPEKIGPIEASLLDVVELASNIRQNGLTNPITVARSGEVYHLETGERRWLAYHLLYMSFPDERKSWDRIAARVVDQIDIWRQASENGVRSNLNAISRARQLAILIMELYRQQGVKFQSFEELVPPGSCDREYYAQVADGTNFDLPRGSGEMVRNAMGFKQSMSQLREYRKLLRMPDEVWQIADDLNWTQGRIRDLERKSLNNRKRFISLAVSAATAERYRVGIPAADSPTPVVETQKDERNPFLSKENKRLFTSLRNLATRVGEGGGHTTVDDLNHIRNMRAWLDEMEKIVRENLKK